MGESADSARLTLLGVLVAALVMAAVAMGGGAPRSTGAASAAAQAATAPTPGATTTRPAGPPVTSVRVIPGPTRRLAAPAPRHPLPAFPSHLAPAYNRLPITEKVIFLGIDDGAVRDPAVLDHFGELHIPFTAFLTLGPAQEDPAFWRRALTVGGTIQSHTINHPDLTTVGGATLRREVCGTLDPFEQAFYRRPTLFRPPYGSSNDAVRRQAAECGYKAVILWKGSTNNGRLTMQEGPLHPGDIILLHWRDTLRDDIDDVVARCRREGFSIGRLEDYLR
jgi:peptidoglycan/xylan/chitin deacetylase (PgdA/CDA1 family)